MISAPGDVLALQRLVGNRNVSRELASRASAGDGIRPGPLPQLPAIPRPLLRVHGTAAGSGGTASSNTAVHRKLPTDKNTSTLKVTEDGGTLGPLISDFNKRERKLSPVEKIEKLNAISRYVYAWFGSQDTKDLAGVGGKTADAVRKLEASISKHHQDAVEKLLKQAPKDSKTTGGDLKVEGEEMSARDKALLLLQEFASGTGAIKITGSGAFVKKAHSMLYRIMESPTGLQLLEDIVAKGGADRPVTIGEGEPPSELKGHLSEASPKESKAVPQVTKVGEEQATENKEALAKELTTMKKLDGEPDDKDAYGAVAGPGDIHAAVMSGKKGIQFVNGDTTDYYEWGKGAYGVYVALVFKKPEESQDNINVGGKSVYTPEFVTLGHELGHALNILAGSSSLTCEELFAMFAGDVGTFENRSDTGKNWSNAEEVDTINFVENKIRQELGLDLRGGHAGVHDQDLEDRMQALKGLTRQAEAFVYEVERVQKKGSSAEKKLAGIRQSLNTLGKIPVQGLSPSQKRNRCADYESGFGAALKKIGALGKGVKDKAKPLWDGQYAPLKLTMQQNAAGAIPKWLE